MSCGRRGRRLTVMVLGGVWAFARFFAALPSATSSTLRGLRRNLGRVILLDLEILIIADIVRTGDRRPRRSTAWWCSG